VFIDDYYFAFVNSAKSLSQGDDPSDMISIALLSILACSMIKF
jgi:hypothetical protein